MTDDLIHRGISDQDVQNWYIRFLSSRTKEYFVSKNLFFSERIERRTCVRRLQDGRVDVLLNQEIMLIQNYELVNIKEAARRDSAHLAIEVYCELNGEHVATSVDEYRY